MHLINKLIGPVAAIERGIEWIGRAVSWLVVACVLLVCYDLSMRYFFHAGSVAIQELEWHLFAMLFLLGAAYTLKHDEHVRVDVLYRSRWVSDRQRLLIDTLGGLLLLIPFCTVLIYMTVPFVMDAFRFAETSPDPGGLPHRWMIKAIIPLGFLLLLLEAIALTVKNALSLVSARK